jgi:acyl carrier protein
MSEVIDGAVLARVCDLVAAVLKADPAALTRETSRADIEAWDSLGHLMLMMEVEVTFRVRFSAVDIGQPQTIAQLCELVTRTRRSS